MKIAVMGAGAVGCYFGAVLAQGGQAVTLIGRPQHVQAVKERGLRLQARGFDGYLPVEATTEPSGISGADIVLFCVKSADTEEAGHTIAPFLKPDAAILSLQNGVDNAERLEAVLGRTVIPAVVYVASEMAGPGHVRHHGRGDLLLGPSAESSRVAAQLSDAGLPAAVSPDVAAALWEKLILNCAYNALSAIPQLPYGRFVQVEGVVDVIRCVVAECVEVARVSGVPTPDGITEKVIAFAGSMPDQYSSTAQDLARGKRSEIDYLNGYIVRKGEQLGVATPANRVLHVLVKLVEEKAR